MHAKPTQIAIGENWPFLMYTVIDTVGPDQPFQQGNNPAAGLYFVVIQVVLHFFMFEIFTGVIIDNFSRMKALNHVRFSEPVCVCVCACVCVCVRVCVSMCVSVCVWALLVDAVQRRHSDYPLD